MTITAGRPWHNWGRSVSSHPAFLATATTVDDVRAALDFARDRGLTVKPIGAGHSFTAIGATDGVQLDVAGSGGLLSVDGTLVRIGAGTYLYQLPALLAPLGLALENIGDIDTQTIAGATSTGTHGTGAAFGGMCTQIEAMTLVTADGTLLTISADQNAELLPAARIGLGALGVVVDVTLRCVPDYMVHAVEKAEPLDEVLDDWAHRATSVDHFEFFWFAHTTSALTKSHTRMPASTPRRVQGRLAAWVDDQLLPNRLYAALCELGVRMPSAVPPLNRLSERLVSTREIIDSWHPVFTSPRRVRFREMEYAISREAVPDALREIRATIQRHGWRITFPVEVRATASDDNWLSTAYGRDTGYIAVHRYYREDPTEYFAAVESIMTSFGGRPHWGKMHRRNAENLRPAYPRLDDFLAIRDRLDPGRLFANDYLRKVLGE